MDRGAWRVRVHGVAESRTRLSTHTKQPKPGNFKEPPPPPPAMIVLQVLSELPKFFKTERSLSHHRLAQHSLGAGPPFALKAGLGGEGPGSTCAPAVLRHLPLHQPRSWGVLAHPAAAEPSSKVGKQCPPSKQRVTTATANPKEDGLYRCPSRTNYFYSKRKRTLHLRSSVRNYILFQVDFNI